MSEETEFYRACFYYVHVSDLQEGDSFTNDFNCVLVERVLCVNSLCFVFVYYLGNNLDKIRYKLTFNRSEKVNIYRTARRP